MMTRSEPLVLSASGRTSRRTAARMNIMRITVFFLILHESDENTFRHFRFAFPTRERAVFIHIEQQRLCDRSWAQKRCFPSGVMLKSRGQSPWVGSIWILSSFLPASSTLNTAMLLWPLFDT